MTMVKSLVLFGGVFGALRLLLFCLIGERFHHDTERVRTLVLSRFLTDDRPAVGQRWTVPQARINVYDCGPEYSRFHYLCD